MSLSLASLARPLSILPALFRRASRNGRVARGDMLGHGLSRRDGVVVGAWFGSCPGMRKGLVVGRSPCGRRLTHSMAPDDMWGVLRRVIALRDDIPATEAHLSAVLAGTGVAQGVAEGPTRAAAAGMRDTAAAFLDTLDPAMLAVAATGLRIAAPPEDMDRTLGGDPALAALALSYPTLFGMLRRRLDDCLQDLPTDASRHDEWDAVARLTVRDLTGAPAWAVAHVPALNAMLVASAPAGRDVDGGVVREMDTLLALPPSWAPSTPEGWEAFGRVSDGIRKARSLPARAADLPLLLASKGRWRGWGESLASHVPVGGTLESAVGNVADVQRAFHRQVLGPAARMHGMNAAHHHEIARDVMWSGLSLRSILALSARWHLARAAIEVRVAAANPLSDGRAAAHAWGAGLPDHADGGLAFRILVTLDELVEEGRTMSHCVGGYGSECRSGKSRIVSVRRVLAGGGWERVSTA